MLRTLNKTDKYSIGSDAMHYLLSKGSIFEALPNDNYLQISGIPLFKNNVFEETVSKKRKRTIETSITQNKSARKEVSWNSISISRFSIFYRSSYKKFKQGN